MKLIAFSAGTPTRRRIVPEPSAGVDGVSRFNRITEKGIPLCAGALHAPRPAAMTVKCLTSVCPRHYRLWPVKASHFDRGSSYGQRLDCEAVALACAALASARAALALACAALALACARLAFASINLPSLAVMRSLTRAASVSCLAESAATCVSVWATRSLTGATCLRA